MIHFDTSTIEFFKLPVKNYICYTPMTNSTMKDQTYVLFKLEIERHFDKTIKTRRDCEQLSVLIYEKTGKIISYNTVRRFFDLAGEKSATKISLATLDIFANFCGYSHYEKFEEGRENSENNLEKIRSLSLKYQQEEQIKLSEIQQLATEHYDNPLFYNFIHELLFHALLKQDVTFISRIFSLEILFENKHYLYKHIYFFIQTLGVQLRNYPEIQAVVWKKWAQERYGRQMYFELFVDMDFLFVSHYKGIEQYLKHSTSNEEILFSNALLFWKSFFLKEEDALAKHIAAIKAIELTNQIHPIPIARSLSCQCIYEKWKTGSISEALITAIHHWTKATKEVFLEGRQIPNFHFWLCEGLIVAQENELVLSLIQDVRLHYFNEKTYFNNGGYERLKVYEALAYARMNEKKKAEALLKAIDPNQFFAFSKAYDSCFISALRQLLGKPVKVNEAFKNLQLECVVQHLIA